MSKNYVKQVLLFVLLAIAPFSYGQDLLHYWNFNDNSTVIALTTPTQSTIAGASLTAVPGGESAIDAAGGTGQNFNVLNLNARNDDPSGTHLRFNLPIGGALLFALPTTGYENIIVKFATRRSGSGAGNQLWSYSLDGTNFISFTTVVPNDGDPGLATLDFTAITGANNNANFKLKVEFEAGDGDVEGNNRFDNFTAEGNAIGGGDILPPVAIITPANTSTGVAVNANPAISFNEDIRLIDNSAINDTNVDALVELRLDNAWGDAVPFDATLTGNTITIVPTTALANNQVYYVALLANAIEDLSDNAIASVTSATFTTIAVQTQFGAGDLAFVAYRMNATAVEDEIAVVSFVDILAGTTINFTDSKYTTNAQPQCANGIVWTANQCIPSGTVIAIQTSALITNIGTVTGAGFGLSSGGDQVIVYTGTAAAPNYITALSSNGWVATNTSCGGSLSMLPAGLIDGQTSMNASTSPGNVAGNSANGFYSGMQTGTPADLRNSIQNPANWTTAISGSAAQTWPTWSFPRTLAVQNAIATSLTTIEVTFNNNLDNTSASDISNYTGIPDLASVAVVNNVATLTFSTPFAPAADYSLIINNIEDINDVTMACPYTYTFNSSLSTHDFNQNTGFIMFPNPSVHGIVNFNRPADITVFDFTGKLIYTAKEVSGINTAGFSTGLYLVKTADGISKKLIVN
jgi:hypothetical protein